MSYRRLQRSHKSVNLRDDMKAAAERAVGQTVEHLHKVSIVETFKEQIIWQGFVEVFWVANPPPSYVYTWMTMHQSGPEWVAVLGVPPINSALDAVRAWL